MDPNTTLRAFRSALATDARDQARTCLASMARWAEYRGFAPAGFRTSFDAYAAMRAAYDRTYPDAAPARVAV